VPKKTGSLVFSERSTTTSMANEPRAYYSIGSVFNLALFDDDALKTECISSFDKLQPRQYELVRDTNMDFAEPTSPPYTRAILEDLMEGTNIRLVH